MSDSLRFPDLRLLPKLAAAALALFAILYVAVIAEPPPEIGFGNWRTTNFGSATDDPGSFLLILLDALTFAGLLFIVASGFSLIFGLMRVVNMAHGSFYLLAGYIAYEVQQRMTGQGGFAIAGVDVKTWERVLPVLIAAAIVSVVGLVVQQTLLRWNQGQDLRQALLTIAGDCAGSGVVARRAAVRVLRQHCGRALRHLRRRRRREEPAACLVRARLVRAGVVARRHDDRLLGERSDLAARRRGRRGARAHRPDNNDSSPAWVTRALEGDG